MKRAGTVASCVEVMVSNGLNWLSNSAKIVLNGDRDLLIQELRNLLRVFFSRYYLVSALFLFGMKIAAFLFTDWITQAARNTRLMLVCLIWCSALVNVEANCQRILQRICLRIGLLYVRLVCCVIIFIDSWKYGWQKWIYDIWC